MSPGASTSGPTDRVICLQRRDGHMCLPERGVPRVAVSASVADGILRA
jgi:hypothetical protein